MRNKRNIKYSYMAGSRQQHLTCSFMRACLCCLTLVDTDVLLCMYLLLLLWCCCCIAVGCGVATINTTAALVHEGTEETCTYRENENTAVQK